MSRGLLSVLMLAALATPALADGPRLKGTVDLTDISAAKRTFTPPARKIVAPRVIKPRVIKPRVVAPIKPVIVKRKVVFIPKKLVVGPGKAKFVGPKFAGPVVKLKGGKVAPLIKTQKLVYWKGSWKKYVPLAALSVVLFSGRYWWADSYVSLARPYCSGVTPDGCRLNWQPVEFEGGGEELQCVRYCGRPGAAPPPRTVAFADTPPSETGKCEISIYGEPEFAGTGVPTNEDQPRLSTTGWDNQISSIKVEAGTWEVFTEESFTGASMRLPPGSYPQLGPEWTKKIGSFMCVTGD